MFIYVRVCTYIYIYIYIIYTYTYVHNRVCLIMCVYVYPDAADPDELERVFLFAFALPPFGWAFSSAVMAATSFSTLAGFFNQAFTAADCLLWSWTLSAHISLWVSSARNLWAAADARNRRALHIMTLRVRRCLAAVSVPKNSTTV